jgi:Ras-related protein Rab-11A
MSTSYKIKVLLVGSGNVGKRELVNLVVKYQSMPNYTGVEILTKDVMLRNGEIATLSLWDIKNQRRFEFIRTTFYKGASGALLVFDLTRKETYDEVTQKWDEEITRACGAIPYILVGNKAELCEKVGRVMDPAEAQAWAKKNNSLYIETSSAKGEHLDEALQDLAEIMVGLKT